MSEITSQKIDWNIPDLFPRTLFWDDLREFVWDKEKNSSIDKQNEISISIDHAEFARRRGDSLYYFFVLKTRNGFKLTFNVLLRTSVISDQEKRTESAFILEDSLPSIDDLNANKIDFGGMPITNKHYSNFKENLKLGIHRLMSADGYNDKFYKYAVEFEDNLIDAMRKHPR